MDVPPEKGQPANRAWKYRAGLALAAIVAGASAFLLWNNRAQDSAEDGSDELLRIKWRKSASGLRPVSVPKASAATSPVAAADDGSTSPHLSQLIKLADPEVSGWASEALSDAAKDALKVLATTMLAHRDDERWPGGAAEIVAEEFTSTAVRNLQNGSDPLLDDGEFSVWPSNVPAGVDNGAQATVLGLEGFRALAKQFVGDSPTAASDRLTFKVAGIEVDGSAFETRVLVELVHPLQGGGSRQRNAVWECVWQKPVDATQSPRLRSIRQSFDQQVYRRREGTAFQDCTASAMKHAESYRAQFLRGADYWAQRISILEGTSFLGHHGLAVGDVNGDRLDDLYVCDGGGLPNRLYVQNDDGTLRDVSQQSGTDWLEYTPAALLVDLDNDGDQDLVLATVAMVLFMDNDGSGKFSLRGGHHGVAQARSLSAADYDADGDLDIYVCSYANPNKATGFGTRGVSSSIPMPYNDAENGSSNALLENHGEFRFVDVTGRVGLDQNNTRFSFAASWEDFDLDGDADLYVANDFGRNCLHRNGDGPEPGSRIFKDVAGELDVEDMASGMSVSWGDCNGDGRPDLYVGNMFSAAGQRIAYQRRFDGQRGEAGLDGLRRMARGNSLFLGNAEGGRFADVSERAGVTMGRWAWSSKFTDLNNDGLLDIVVGNGFLTNRQDSDL